MSESAGSLIGPVVALELVLVLFAFGWIVFTKAGQPGWASLIPIYNVYILLQITGMSGWWILALFIPIVNIGLAILVSIGVARSFGKSAAFAAGLLFLPIVFYPILAFGDAKYRA